MTEAAKDIKFGLNSRRFGKGSLGLFIQEMQGRRRGVMGSGHSLSPKCHQGIFLEFEWN